MSEKIEPALTSEEWKGILADPYWWEYRPPQHGGHSTPVITERHGLAAAALYGQSFGFTHADVEILRQLPVEGLGLGDDFDGVAKWRNGLVARIAALLPEKK